MRGFVGRSSGNARSSGKSSSKNRDEALVVCVCRKTRSSNSLVSSYTKLSKICSPRILWHTWRMRGWFVSIQALTIASSADILPPHCALSKPLNLYTGLSFRLKQLILPSYHAKSGRYLWSKAIVPSPAIIFHILHQHPTPNRLNSSK